jgi:hypothetical protein
VSKLDEEGNPEHDLLFPAKVHIRMKKSNGEYSHDDTQNCNVFSTLEVRELSQKVLTVYTKPRNSNPNNPGAAAIVDDEGGIGASKIIDTKETDDYTPHPKKSSGMTVDIKIRGMAVSVIDSAPKELMCFSILDLDMKMKDFVADKHAKVEEQRT